tara:strand:+ start:1815 stop:2321 length:507 start_codon:yes stop_codon:yes gene_type:complete
MLLLEIQKNKYKITIINKTFIYKKIFFIIMANNNKGVCSMKPLDILMYIAIAYLLYVIIAQKPLIPKEIAKPLQPATKVVEPVTKPIAKAVQPVARPVVQAAGSTIKHAGSELGKMAGSPVKGVEAMRNRRLESMKNKNVERMSNKKVERMSNKIEGYSTSAPKYARV